MENETLTVDLKLKGVEISLDTADSIIAASMLEQYYYLKKDVEFQKNIKKPLEYQKEDLENDKKLLDATITMLKHYTAMDHWPKELTSGESWPEELPSHEGASQLNTSVVCSSLIGLSDTLKAENNNAENSTSVRKYNKELIDAVTMIVSYYDSPLVSLELDEVAAFESSLR